MNAPMQVWIQITGWTLIHFVWQGGLIAVATAAGRSCAGAAPEARGRVWADGDARRPIVTAALVASVSPIRSASSRSASAFGPINRAQPAIHRESLRRRARSAFGPAWRIRRSSRAWLAGVNCCW
jgi:hypothetical protein